MDLGYIIKLCLEKHMFRALIYLSTVGENDFITPMVQILSHYEYNKTMDHDPDYKKHGYRF